VAFWRADGSKERPLRVSQRLKVTIKEKDTKGTQRERRKRSVDNGRPDGEVGRQGR